MSEIIDNKAKKFIDKSCFVNDEKNALYFYKAEAYNMKDDVITAMCNGWDQYYPLDKKNEKCCDNCEGCDQYAKINKLFSNTELCDSILEKDKTKIKTIINKTIKD